MTVEKLITDHINIWSSALQTRSTAGRGSNGKIDLYGIKKLRELILELAVRGKLVPQDPNDEPASELLKRIAAEKAELVKQGKIKKQKPLPEISEDEKPFELPVGWEWVRLGALGYTQTGGTPSKSNAEYFGNDIPFIKPADITAQEVVYNNEGLSVQGADSLGRVAPIGSILMVCIGTIGKCQIINRACSFNQQINSITPFVDMSDFIFISLSSYYFQSLAWNYSSSTTIAILNKRKWESLLVPVAPFSEQVRIVINVEKLMALCDQLEQQSQSSLDTHKQLVETLLATLTGSQNADELTENWARISQYFDTLFTTEASIDALQQTILQLAVMGKLVPQDPNDEPASELLKRIEQQKAQLVKEGKIKKQKPLPPVSDEEKPFELPKGWEWCRLETITELITKGSSPKWQGVSYTDNPDDILFITSENVGSFKILLDSEKYVEKKFNEIEPRSILTRNDILMNIVGASIGRTAIFNMNKNANINQAVCLIRVVNNSMLLSYLLNFFNSEICLSYMFDKQVDNARANLSMGNIAKFVLPIPPLNEQKRIVEHIDNLMSICYKLKSRLQSAQKTQLHLADALTDAALN
ncbi:TPA: restriction endonuclease subunit S [Serratia marcescens]|uniref:restriction endonuclease subunit S n=1 Tax=Serratia sp. CY29653 TaxID=3383594 RepID=UPI001A1ED880|nr:restriction endonuclease subunit S [Serratia marcescens]HAT4972736.1 restriction endonuclease subunit S [Serratia marcescens]HAT4988439.1 restriction endonuclease subunit S [Serratia marcescens]HAT5049541.1 restriction endonuclease subunit S [Serratia marcescens]HEJ7077061.1 restriction endonuclease subunit S [Serratia marcescens]